LIRLRTAIEASIAVILFGCIPVVIKSIAADAWTVGIVRLVIGAAGIAAFMRFRGESFAIARRDMARLAVIGTLFFGHWLTFFFAIKLSSSSIAAIGLSTYGIHLLLLGALTGVARLRALDALAVAIAIAGAVLVVPSFSRGNATTTGMLLSVSSAVMYAALPLLHQRWSHLSTSIRALGQFTVACALFLLFLPKSHWQLSTHDWAGLIFLGIGTTLIAHGLWVRVTTELSPALTSILYYGNVPIAIALGVIFLHEPLSARTLLGAALIIGGSLLGLTHQWQLRKRAESEMA
jgi:drug/metabolite transporter (DMT)-like permease